ncbi:MAG TPA: DegV family protein [Acidimicrobiales bacterium]
MVVTDSSGCPEPGAAPPAAVAVVPIIILLADRQVRDDEIDPAVVDTAIARGEPVKTRAPSVVDYLDAVESRDAQAAVIVTPAAEVTAMWRHACHTPWLADRPVAVVDSRTAAAGQALVVEAAAQAAAAGNSLADVVGVAHDAAARARVIGAVGTAEPLLAAGVVEREQVEACGGPRRGRRDGLRPTVFEARHGQIEPLRVLDGEDPVDALAALYARERRAGDPVAFTGAGAGPDVRAMAARLAALTGSSREPAVCSPAMTIHTGRGVLGLAWLDRA